MYRLVLSVAAVLLLVAAAVRSAAADDLRVRCLNSFTTQSGDDAIAACTRLLEANPRSLEANYVRGLAYLKKGDYDRAISDFDEAIRRDPKHSGNAYSFRGRAYAYRRDYDRAIADLDRALRDDPRNVFAYPIRGDVYFAKGDHDRAIADYERAIRLVPSDAVPYVGRGNAYFAKGDYDRAIADYGEAIRLGPGNPLDRYSRPEIYLSRGNAYDAKGDYDRAIADYDQAIGLYPPYATAYNNRANAYNQKGDHDRALVDAGEAIRLDPGLAPAYATRGEAYEGRHDPARALADFDQALKLDPSLADAQRGRERVQPLLAKRPDPGTPDPGTHNPSIGTGVAGRRIALVIGMSAYASVPPLRNPAGDARAIADAFRRLGFAEVVEREDLTRAKLEETLKAFGDNAAEADWAVIYYAGHGVEVNGENYLVPVDATLARAEHVEDEAVALKRVLSKTEAAHKLHMVILDACRSNPFRMASAAGRSRGVSRGLSPVEPARGVLVAYAARDGTTADDGDTGHSPFTQALLANLETPGLDIRIMFSKVRDQVLERTHNVQEPFTYGSLPGEELYFRAAGR